MRPAFRPGLTFLRMNYPRPLMKIIELELPDDVVARLDEAARSLDTSPEDLARVGIEEKLYALPEESLPEEFPRLTSFLYIVDQDMDGYRMME